jgi:hypothetical protein
MAVQEGRSKDCVVRLETFFPTAAVAPHAPPVRSVRRTAAAARVTVLPGKNLQEPSSRRYAALAAAAVASNRTLTRFETPDSSMVTP